jgi:hypothetical protein
MYPKDYNRGQIVPEKPQNPQKFSGIILGFSSSCKPKEQFDAI